MWETIGTQLAVVESPGNTWGYRRVQGGCLGPGEWTEPSDARSVLAKGFLLLGASGHSDDSCDWS